MGKQNACQHFQNVVWPEGFGRLSPEIMLNYYWPDCRRENTGVWVSSIFLTLRNSLAIGITLDNAIFLTFRIRFETWEDIVIICAIDVTQCCIPGRRTTRRFQAQALPNGQESRKLKAGLHGEKPEITIRCINTLHNILYCHRD